jgi:hypothetical protein
MKKGDFDIEKTFGQVVPLRSVRAREDWPLPTEQSGQDQQTQHHNKQEEPGRDDTDPSAGEADRVPKRHGTSESPR